jgi:hypothetical protein
MLTELVAAVEALGGISAVWLVVFLAAGVLVGSSRGWRRGDDDRPA